MAGGSVVGYATLPIIPSFKGFGTNLAGQVGSGSATAGAASGKLFSAGFAKYLGAAALVAGAVVAFKGLYEIGNVYRDVSNTIRIGTGATGEALQGLNDSAKRISTTVPASLGDIGTAVADVNTRLGYSGPVLEGFTSRMLELGRMSGAAVNVNDLSASMTGFKVPASDANETLEELFRISQATGVPVNTLTAALKGQGGVLTQLGFSLGDSAALLGTLDKAGVDANAVVRSMSMGLVRLAADGEAPIDAFDRVTGELEGFIEAGDQASALDIAGKVFGTRGAAQFVAALNSGTVSLSDLRGSLETTGDTILGVSAETRNFKENLLLVKNKGMDILAPAGEGLFKLLNDGFTKLTNFIVGLPPLGDIFGPVMDSMGPVLETIGGALMPIFQSLWASIAPLIPQFVQLWTTASPVMLIFKALEPLLPTLVGLISQLGEMISSALGTILPMVIPIVTQLADILGEVLAMVLPIIIDLMTSLAPVLETLFEAVMPVVSAVLDLIGPILDLITPLLELLGPILGPLIDIVVMLIKTALDPLIQVFKLVLPPVMDIVTGIVQSLMPVIEGITTALGGLIKFITGVFTGDWEKAWEGIKQFFGGIWDGIVGILKGAVNLGIDLINGIIGGINGALGGISDATGGAINLRIPKIPRLALGADIFPKMGGTLAVLGEGGQAETVTNLGTTNRALEATTALANRALAEGSSARSGNEVNLYVTNPVGQPVEETVRANAQLIGAGLSV